MPSTRGIPIWKQAPFIRILFPFSMGVLVAWYLPLSSNFIGLFTFSCLVLVLCLRLLSLQIKYYYGYLQGLSLHFLVFATGLSLLFFYKAPNHTDWIGNQPFDNHFLLGKVLDAPAKRNQSYKLILQVEGKISKETKIKASGLVLVYLRSDSNAARIVAGDQLLLKPRLSSINASGNPGAFNYQRYLSYSNIYFQAYADSHEWITVRRKTDQSLRKWFSSLQESILSRIKNFINQPKEQGLAEALLIGYKADLDKNLVQAYSNTGVVHVIAISGLHLGLIYWLLNLLFYPFRKHKRARLPISLLILMGLWIFSILSGASPSVLRSAVMFSFIIIGNSSARKISVYNSLAASAFFLLCFNPCWLWDIGFQLSYVAVLSIVVFMKPIYHLMIVQNKLLDLLWQLSSVTIAAQILTTPLSIYHFHQFPVLFLLTNLVAVPLSSLILLGEVLLVSIATFQYPSQILGKIIEWMIRLMNNYIEYMNAFPFSTWNALSISLTQTVLLYLIIVSSVFYSQKRSTVMLSLTLSSFFAFFAIRTISFLQAKQQEVLIVYNVPKLRAIDIGFGHRVHFIGDDSIIRDPGLKRTYLYSTRTLFRLTEEFPLPEDGLLTVGQKKVLFINQHLSTLRQNIFPSTDILILSNNPRFSLQELQRSVVFNQLVLDASNNTFTCQQWKADCASQNIACHAVSLDGAFVMK